MDATLIQSFRNKRLNANFLLFQVSSRMIRQANTSLFVDWFTYSSFSWLIGFSEVKEHTSLNYNGFNESGIQLVERPVQTKI